MKMCEQRQRLEKTIWRHNGHRPQHRRTEVEGVNSTEDVSREVEKITALMFSPELKPNANIS